MCTIGVNATTICGVTGGGCALIGSETVVSKDITPYALTIGDPIKQISWVSKTLLFVNDNMLIDKLDDPKYILEDQLKIIFDYTNNNIKSKDNI